MNSKNLNETYTVQYFVYHASLLEHSEREYFDFVFFTRYEALVRIEQLRQQREVQGLKLISKKVELFERD